MDNLKHENESCISNIETYKWVFNPNPDRINDSYPQSFSTSSDDSVFIDNSILNSIRKNRSVSFTKEQNSFRIWEEKRKKILHEITTPRCGDYFKFPELNYGSYRETMLPRIKYTSLIRSNIVSSSFEQTEIGKKEPVFNKSNRVSGKSSKKEIFPTKVRHATINRSIRARNVNEDTYNHFIYSKKASIMSNSSNTFDAEHAVRCPECYFKMIQNFNPNTNTMNYTQSEVIQQNLCESSDIQCHCNCCYESIKLDEDNHTKIIDYSNTENSRASCAHLVSFDFEAWKTEPEINLTVNYQKTFKNTNNQEYKLRYNNQKNIMRKYSLSKDIPLHNYLPSATAKNSMLGKVIPITIKKTSLSRMKSFPISPRELGNSKNKALKCDSQNQVKILCSSIPLTDFPTIPNVKHLALKREEALKNEIHKAIPKSGVEVDQDKLKNASFNVESSIENIRDLSETCSNHEVTKSKENESCVKKKPVIRFPSILTGCPTGPDGKTDISNLIMDEDSLLGLSEEELLDRTNRIRKLWKSVGNRSKERKKQSYA